MTELVMESDLRPKVVEGIVQTEPEVRTADWSDWLRAPAKAPARSAPIWTIQRKPHSISLKRPLLVRVHLEDEFVFAQNETLAICGTGSSVEEAMADFCVHVIHFYEYYKTLPATKAIGDALRLKKTFRELFVED